MNAVTNATNTMSIQISVDISPGRRRKSRIRSSRSRLRVWSSFSGAETKIRSPGMMFDWEATMTARWMTFSSSRTLPGHAYDTSRSTASRESGCTWRPARAAWIRR